jgi:shikimate dehydrogenase
LIPAATRPVTASTKVAAVIGSPIRHSLSPVLHNAAFTATGLDWTYVAFDVAAGGGADAVAAMRSLGLAGMSVTMPLKDEVAAAADRRTPAAELLGTANCLYWDGDSIVADSTDGEGCVWALVDHSEVQLDGLRVAVLGAGGAARSIIAALGLRPLDSLVVINRTAAAAERAVALGGPNARLGSLADLADAHVVINATSVGMNGGPAGMPCPPALMNPAALAVDLVYSPLVTEWMLACEARGLRVLGGLPMLIGQAAVAFTRWTGHEAPVEEMIAAASVAVRSTT